MYRIVINIIVFTVPVPYILSNKKIDRLVACELARLSLVASLSLALGACRCDLLASTLKSYKSS